MEEKEQNVFELIRVWISFVLFHITRLISYLFKQTRLLFTQAKCQLVKVQVWNEKCKGTKDSVVWACATALRDNRGHFQVKIVYFCMSFKYHCIYIQPM